MNFQKINFNLCTFQDNCPNSWKVGDTVIVNDGGPWSTAKVRIIDASLTVEEGGYHRWTFIATYAWEQPTTEQHAVPRYINKELIHTKAVEYGRSRKGMKRTANRLAKCNVDKIINSLVSILKPEAWANSDDVIIQGCAQRLWLDFCIAESRLQTEA